ncbi:ERAD-associated E3 ubiquitin-protein ligase doa10 [Cyphellophora attinorum]|uniref:RING-type E3 ubiquitin transferase n=1 Tax=Cyphellophora attinorum TaxID=1664694 RepID=A0A0N1HHG8_9EURO|nr:ERAD-associated E3 ubiquitin-protein ligase doa10 [Phialophora attinorum]KPI45453.1 ERAD-associated E3 ubiquitin-protein ligase doa10 [Phialophora attinorum]
MSGSGAEVAATSTSTDASLQTETTPYIIRLLVKVFRLLLSLPPSSFDSSTTANNTTSQIRQPTVKRQSSLLSGTFVEFWTSSSLASNFSIDIVEGIMISLGLVASFILVFLIREWVINQQPMLNNPEPADGEDINVQDQNDVQRPLIRPRRRRQNAELVHNPAVDNPLAANARRNLRPRAMTDDNIVASAPPRAAPVRSQSLVTPTAGIDEVPISASAPLQSEDDVAPVLLRGMVGDAVDARRVLEERIVDGDPVTASNDASDHPASTNASASTPGLEFPTDDPLSQSIEIERQIPVSPPEGDITASVRGEASQNAAPAIAGAVEDAPEGASQATAVDEAEILERLNSTDPAVEREDNDTPAVAADFPLGRLGHWFWHVEGVPHVDRHRNLPHELPNEQNNATNAHGLAQAGAGGHHGHVAPEAPRQPQLLPDEAMPPGFDANDPNAFEDAEELEGVLELIGMEGPIVGMVQNVVFSLILISLTLSAALWIPYIWGKIGLIVVTNPITVFVRGPIYFIARAVDLIADGCFFLLGLLGLVFNMLAKVVKQITKSFIPTYSDLIDVETFEELAINVTARSGSRLERNLSGAVTWFNPDLPTFSAQSHKSLVIFKASIVSFFSGAAQRLASLYDTTGALLRSPSMLVKAVHTLILAVPRLPGYITNTCVTTARSLSNVLSVKSYPSQEQALKADVPATTSVHWSASDKVIAVVIGYIVFAVSAAIFMKVAHAVMGLKKDQKLDGSVFDRIREAGGVMKVIVIIGIEMIVFPLYCGLLLDLALLPLFEGATINTRLAFIYKAPCTGLFLHWFAGTCYMFHFALFVSMCRKILRKGVLYFIRDPDDPTFHPVRDVLERPVPTQLGKIAFSALVYGGLVIMCLGGVVWSIGRFTSVLPIHFTGNSPKLAFPVDVVFFNIVLQFGIRKLKPSEKISAVYEWWFRGIAHGLRLSHFLFGEEREDEKKPRMRNGVLSWHRMGKENESEQPEKEGTYVRAPASDFCRIPKNQKAFLEVDEENKRIDGLPDSEKGLHGSDNANFKKIWLPPQFKPRMATCVILLWLFAASTGIGCTIGPLVIGRWILHRLLEVEGPVNDLYALTIGLHLLAAAASAAYFARSTYGWIHAKSTDTIPPRQIVVSKLMAMASYVARYLYLAISIGVIIPFTLSLIVELYIHIPIYTYLLKGGNTNATHNATIGFSGNSTSTANPSSTSLAAPSQPIPPTVFLLQTWALGLFYLRLILRTAMNYPCQHEYHAAALRSIYRNGYRDLDVRLATRALIIPLTLLCTVLLLLPLLVAKITTKGWKITDEAEVMKIYRAAYPCVMSWGLLVYLGSILKVRLSVWRTMVRDEVYLVGERLHNYVNPVTTPTAAGDEGKGKAKAIPISSDLVDVASVAANAGSADDDDMVSDYKTPVRKDNTSDSAEVPVDSHESSASKSADEALLGAEMLDAFDYARATALNRIDTGEVIAAKGSTSRAMGQKK